MRLDLLAFEVPNRAGCVHRRRAETVAVGLEKREKILFAVYDNGSYDHVFPMGFGALAAVLKRDGHEIVVWSQDMNHWPDDHLRTYLDENKFDVVVLSIIAGYYQYQKVQ